MGWVRLYNWGHTEWWDAADASIAYVDPRRRPLKEKIVPENCSGRVYGSGYSGDYAFFIMNDKTVHSMPLPSPIRWKRDLPEMHERRMVPSAVVTHNKLFVMGGSYYYTVCFL